MAVYPTFDPVGCCIYCGKKNVTLGDEHIIPFGLGGKLVLPKSSCKSCEAITGKFEGVVQRTIYGDFRMTYNMPSRRAKDRPRYRKMGVIEDDGSRHEMDIPVEEYPAPLWVYTTGNCGIFLGTPPDLDVSMWNMKTVHNIEELQKFQKKFKWDGKLTTKFMSVEFSRMLAKIGYSFAVAAIGYGGFRSLIADAILRDKTNISYWMGMNEEMEPRTSGIDGVHSIELALQGRLLGTTLLIAYVRLFSVADTPTYHVVVGEFIDIQQETFAIDQLKKHKSIKLARNSGKVVPPFVGGV